VAHHQLEPAVDGILWSLTPGQLSAPFQGRFGYEIVQVEERRIRPLDAVRESIIGNLKAALESREQEIISAAHISLEPAFVDGSLPCETRAFNLPDKLDPP
jgi:parvulin-like peptidyl-prolyl isomerase